MKSMPKVHYSVTKPFLRYEGNVKEFWTKKEYEYQELILNDFVIHRERPGYYKSAIPKARVDLLYDGPKGLGRKSINGNEVGVYKEATKFFTRGELAYFNTKWTKAKYLGLYDHKDQFCREPLTDKDTPPWHKDNYEVNHIAPISKEKIQEFKSSPLQDLFLTQNLDPKDFAKEGGLSSFYNYIQGKRELPKDKAEEYARLLGIAPQSLMFEPRMITCWGNVDLQDKHNDENNNIYLPGEVRFNEVTYTVPCPAEIFRYDIKAIAIDHAKSAYDGWIAYYYETNTKNDNTLHNKLCLVRWYDALEDEKGNRFGPDVGFYRYFIGIYQIYGNTKRILNLDPSAENRIVAEGIEPDLVAPIVSFTNPKNLEVTPTSFANKDDIHKIITLLNKEKQVEQKTRNKLSEYINEKFYINKKEQNSQIKKMEESLDKVLKNIEKSKREQEKVKKELEMLLYKQKLQNELDAEVENFKSKIRA